MHTLRIFVAFVWLAGPPIQLARAGIYAFLDAAGQVHLSNVPDDDRYRRLDLPSDSAGAESREASAITGAESREAPAKTGSGDPPGRGLYADLVAGIARRYGIEAALLHAVISVESRYDAKAVSPHGAAGLMQLMPVTAKRYGVADVFNPEENVRGGAQYLKFLLQLFDDDVHLALAGYNAGEGAVLKHGRRIPPYPETAAYVPKVIDFYNRFRSSN